MFSTCIIFAVEMKEMQFTAIVLTVLMTGVLVFLLPGRVADDRVTNRSRWLMVLAFILTGSAAPDIAMSMASIVAHTRIIFSFLS